MRIQQNHFVAARQRIVQNMLVLITDAAVQAACAAIPIMAVFQHQQAHVVEMFVQDAAPLCLRQLRKAQLQVAQADFTARRHQPIAQPAEYARQKADNAVRQAGQ